MTTRQVLDQAIDPSPARVLVTRDAQGEVVDARFDLAGLPRVDALLAGRPLAEVIALAERLCGICPAAHHLAGIRAYESLIGSPSPPPAAIATRRLLHWGSVIDMLAAVLVFTDRDDALTLRRFAKAAMAAAGSPGHFPATAIPGGVAARPSVAGCAQQVDAARETALRLARQSLAEPRSDEWDGADAALVDDDGHVDLLGGLLRIVAADGDVLVAGAAPDEWDDLVTEAVPGAPAPRPHLTGLGPERGAYRVGPVAQLRAGSLATPLARQLQDEWHASLGGAAAARAIVMLHCVEAIDALLAQPHAFDGELAAPVPAATVTGTGVGWVDGARGLLVHRYQVNPDGLVASATILTPTAQNEPWLAASLRRVAGDRRAMEHAIREADPCLPCAMTPVGGMDLVIDTMPRGGA